MRADAQDNRRKILEAARAAFAASGEASLNSIARQAGVGPGTLYRHFPTREALMLAVYRHDVQGLVDSAPVLLAEHPPMAALRLWFDRLAHYGKVKHGLVDVLKAMSGDTGLSRTYGAIIGALTLLMDACRADGRIRPDLSPEDLLLTLGFLWKMDPKEDWEARTGRMLDIVMAGITVTPPERR